MKKAYWIYGALMAVLLGILEWAEYKYFVRDISMEVLIGLLSILFIIIGIWLGQNLGLSKSAESSSNSQGFDPLKQAESIEAYQISTREAEVLSLLAAGCSNQEIANQLFISLSTVKSHISRIYSKLAVKRRTQAVQKAKSLHLVK